MAIKPTTKIAVAKVMVILRISSSFFGWWVGGDEKRSETAGWRGKHGFREDGVSK
jgi:hypothetical protein